MVVKSITPKEAKALKTFPDKIIETWNQIIIEKCKDGHAVIHQNDIARRLAAAMDITTNKVYETGWLDIENFYRKAGWKVEYDRPGYNETYPATYEFSGT
jgi:hypothetical protein